MESRLPPWAALRQPNFALLAAGQAIAQVGTGMQHIVIAWQIYELTSSALSVGLTGLAQAIPLIVFSLIGGVVADAVDRRRLLLVTQGVAMVLAIMLAALTGTGLISPWMIYLITFLASAASAFDQPARQALVPSLLPRAYINSAVNLLLVIRHAGAIFGPALGGVLVAELGVAPAYWVGAATFVGLIGALLAMRIPPVLGQSRPRIGLGMVTEGMRFIWATPVVLAVMGIDFMNTFFGSTRSAWPTFARDVFAAGPQGLGMLGSAVSIGAVFGIAAALALGDVRHKGLGVILCSLGFGVSVVAFGLGPTLPLAAIGLAGVGFADAVNDSMTHTLVLTVTPDALQGRVNSVAQMLMRGGPSLGQLWIGFLVSTVGPREAMVLGGCAIMVFALSLLLRAHALVRYRTAGLRG